MEIPDAFLHSRDEVIQIHLLTLDDVDLGTLGRVTSGKIDYNVNRTVRGGGTAVLTLSRDISWETARLKILRGIRDPGGGEDLLYGCGVFRPLVGDEDWTAQGATVSVTLLDKTSFLDELQLDHTYSLPVGYQATQAVRELLLEAGEPRFSVVGSDRALSAPMSWAAGTSYLRVINDLLDSLGYFSLWADGDGVLRAEPYVPPENRPVAFHFRNDHRSIVSPEFKVTQAPYKVPNKVIAVSKVEGEEEQLLSVATNENELSPYSYQARGNKWRTFTLENVEVATQEALDDVAVKKLVSLTAAARGVEFSHGWLPLLLNQVVGWTNTRAGIDLFGTVSSWEMSLHEGDLMKTTVTEVVRLW